MWFYDACFIQMHTGDFVVPVNVQLLTIWITYFKKKKNLLDPAFSCMIIIIFLFSSCDTVHIFYQASRKYKHVHDF